MALMAPISRADDDPLTALMMGGSGMPTPSEFWQDTIITDYIDPATGGNYTPVLVPTPESFSSASMPTGLADLQGAIAAQQLNYPGDPYLVEGYSQSAAITVLEKMQLLQIPGSGRTSRSCCSATSTGPTAALTSGSTASMSPVRASTSMGPSRPMPVSRPSTSRTNTTSSRTSRSIRSTDWPT